MPNLEAKDPAERFDLAYLFANGSQKEIKELADTAREIVPGVSARCAMVHVADLPLLKQYLFGSSVRSEVVIDFPDGLGGLRAKGAEAKSAEESLADGGDPVVNLRYVVTRNRLAIIAECEVVKRHLREVKLITQIPYLWQKDRDAIAWLLDLLPEAGIYCIKDWTTRQNFLLPLGEKLDVAMETRVRYTAFMAEYIEKHNLPLLIKIAGGIDATSARALVNAGADLLGISYQKAKSVREALL
ncbi:MAG: hypothetical protein Q7R73_01755 [bacterium]|nr:hypothetical protein [bacterium]